MIDAQAIEDNARVLKAHLGSARLIGVVKADGYGHGIDVAARAALAGGASSLAVATVEEGLTLRERGIDADILVLGTLSETVARDAVRGNLIVTLYHPAVLPWLAAASTALDKPARAHVQIDTGMRRLGAAPKDARALLEAVKAMPSIHLEGIYTHYAEATDDSFTAEQLRTFLPVAAMAESVFGSLLKHTASSGAALAYPNTLLDAARCGIAMYGYPPCETTVPLRPAMRFVTRIVQLQRAELGLSVSYGRTYTTSRETLIATLPVGYGDGYPRCIGNRGYALVRGKRAPVIGRVCMDLCMLDVTDIPCASLDDEVVLLGDQDGALVSAEDWAAWCDTIAYEALLRPTARVRRVVL
jgi:alanine racemase